MTRGFIICIKSIFCWIFWLCQFDPSPACLDAHDKEINDGVCETVRVLSCHRFDELDDHRLGDRVLAFGHSLLVFRIFIDGLEHWVFFPLVAWFFEIRFDLDIPAGVNLHPHSHGIHILFQSRLLYPQIVVCVSPG